MGKEETNWAFLFSMVGIEFLMILIVFVMERLYKA